MIKNLTKAIFDHLVIARRDALDAGACDVESLWAYFMGDVSYRRALDVIRGTSPCPLRRTQKRRRDRQIFRGGWRLPASANACKICKDLFSSGHQP